MVLSEGTTEKTQVTPPGIDPGIVRLVAQRLNHYATKGEIPGTHFQRLSRPQGTWFCRKEPRKISQVTPPEIDPGTVRLVAQRLNHYATSGLWAYRNYYYYYLL